MWRWIFVFAQLHTRSPYFPSQIAGRLGHLSFKSRFSAALTRLALCEADGRLQRRLRGDKTEQSLHPVSHKLSSEETGRRFSRSQMLSSGSHFPLNKQHQRRFPLVKSRGEEAGVETQNRKCVEPAPQRIAQCLVEVEESLYILWKSL